MSLTYGFFDAVYDGETYDRTYTAAQFSDCLRGIVTDGVVANVGAQLRVQAVSGMTVQVGTGRAFADCRWVENDTALNLSIGAAHATLARKDAVVVRLDYSNRLIDITVKAGTPAATPAAPEPQRDATYYELILAEISVPAGATAITPSQITDKRNDESVCGYIISGQSLTVSGVSFNTLMAPGVYQCTNLANMTDKPIMAGRGILEVVKAGDFIIQRFTYMSSGSSYRIFIRTSTDNGSSWNAWLSITIQ